MASGAEFLGIDLGAKRLHVVGLDAALRLGAASVFDASDLGELRGLLKAASVVAIDAPSALSTAPHQDEMSLSAKFRTARCAEIALGQEHKIWVPWVTPTEDHWSPAGSLWASRSFGWQTSSVPM